MYVYVCICNKQKNINKQKKLILHRLLIQAFVLLLFLSSRPSQRLGNFLEVSIGACLESWFYGQNTFTLESWSNYVI